MHTADAGFFLRMDDESFYRLSAYITSEYGITLPPAKKSMLESRLNKKVKSLGMNSYAQFIDFIFSEAGRRSELFNVVDLITTNKTEFYREPAHFQYLREFVLPNHHHDNRSLVVWSAGCSTGEEPYTLLIELEEFRKRVASFSYALMASDVSIRVIQNAHSGIYHKDRISPVPPDLKRVYFLRSKNSGSNLVRVKPEFRRKITYRRINLIGGGLFGLGSESQDIIFCRNVLIYFDKATQQNVIKKFVAALRPGGLLFLGHSESLLGVNVPMRQLRPTIYQRLP